MYTQLVTIRVPQDELVRCPIKRSVQPGCNPLQVTTYETLAADFKKFAGAPAIAGIHWVSHGPCARPCGTLTGSDGSLFGLKRLCLCRHGAGMHWVSHSGPYALHDASMETVEIQLERNRLYSCQFTTSARIHQHTSTHIPDKIIPAGTSLPAHDEAHCHTHAPCTLRRHTTTSPLQALTNRPPHT